MTGFWGMLRVAFNILPKNRATRSEGRLGLILRAMGATVLACPQSDAVLVLGAGRLEGDGPPMGTYRKRFT
jgi:hypothetical protein